MSKFRHKAAVIGVLAAFLTVAVAAQGNPARRPSMALREPGYSQQEAMTPQLGLARFNPFAAEPAPENYLANTGNIRLKRADDTAKISPPAKFANHVIRLGPAISPSESDSQPPSFSAFLQMLKDEADAQAEAAETSELAASSGQQPDTESSSSSSQAAGIGETSRIPANSAASAGASAGGDALPGTMFPRPYQSTLAADRLLLYFPVQAESTDLPEGSRLLMPVGTDIRFAPPGQSVFQRSRATIRREGQP